MREKPCCKRLLLLFLQGAVLYRGSQKVSERKKIANFGTFLLRNQKSLVEIILITSTGGMGYGAPVEDGAPLPEGFGSGGDSVEKSHLFYFFGGKK